MVKMLRAKYSRVSSCVRYDGKVSEVFDICMGLKQGEPLSPILFVLYINDMSESVHLAKSHSFVIYNLYIFCLLL
jgi:hypothetical protein